MFAWMIVETQICRVVDLRPKTILAYIRRFESHRNFKSGKEIYRIVVKLLFYSRIWKAENCSHQEPHA